MGMALARGNEGLLLGFAAPELCDSTVNADGSVGNFSVHTEATS
jgi:hypothetical protein